MLHSEAKTEIETVRICVSDIDQCAFAGGGANSTSTGLSVALVNHVRAQDYHGIYFCTARHLMAHEKFMSELSARFGNLGYTRAVIKNFCFATKLVFLGVSTPDDEAPAFRDRADVGKAFESVMAPFEASLGYKTPSSDFQIASGQYVDGPEDNYSKNTQLMRIIKDALAKFPGKNIVIDYYDDVKPLCVMAANLILPPNVQLTVYHHEAHLGARIEPIRNYEKDRYSLEFGVGENRPYLLNLAAKTMALLEKRGSYFVENKKQFSARLIDYLLKNQILISPTLLADAIKVESHRCASFFYCRNQVSFSINSKAMTQTILQRMVRRDASEIATAYKSKNYLMR